MSKILIIEDEKNLSRFIELELHHEGYETMVTHDGRSGLQAALDEEWDVILLDLMLPVLNGIEVCRRIRQTKQTPIIMMTARDSVIDKVTGLDHGADDYIVKPFAIEELLARLRSILRRIKYDQSQLSEQLAQMKASQSIIEVRDLIMDLETHVVKRGDEIIELTKKEYEVLKHLMIHCDEIVTRESLLKSVWGTDAGMETNLVDVYIRYVRNKIDVPFEDGYIMTVRGSGYMIQSDDDKE